MEAPRPQNNYESAKKEFVDNFVSDDSRQISSDEENEIKRHRTRLRREAEIIFDEALRYFRDLKLEESNAALRVSLVEIPDAQAREITERIEEAEREFSPDATEAGYKEGSASGPDELKIIQGELPALLTAEHATEHIRSGEPKEADWGTGGLMSVLATDHGTFGIAPLGRQTGDANHEGEHRIKTEAGIIIVQKGIKIALSIHGIGSSKFVTPDQLKSGQSSDIAVGVGDNPTEASLEFASWLEEESKDLDLRLDINPWYMSLSGGQPKMKDDVPLRASFRAAKTYTTRGSMQENANRSGLILPIAQIELASSLRVRPGIESNFEKVYKAYILMSEAILKYTGIDFSG